MLIPASKLEQASYDFLSDTQQGVAPPENHVICLVPNHIRRCTGCKSRIDTGQVIYELELIKNVVSLSIGLSLVNKVGEDVEVHLHEMALPEGLSQDLSNKIRDIALHVIEGFVSSYQT